mmetsp:Transcript_3208/g.19868  ORF Transcript_3208/g.19868 Transcript_3208/m.19868 type:complete len:217 (-) Transcript_3208:3618-4268(-)
MQQAFRHVHGICRREESRMDPRTTQHVRVVDVVGCIRPFFRRMLTTCVAFQPPLHELFSQLGIRRTSGFPEPLQRRHVRRTRLFSFATSCTCLASPRACVRTRRTTRHLSWTCDVHVHSTRSASGGSHGTLERQVRRRRSGDGCCRRIRATLAIGTTCRDVGKKPNTCDVDAEDQRKVRGRGRGTDETSRSTLSTRRNVAGTRTRGRCRRCVGTCA